MATGYSWCMGRFRELLILSAVVFLLMGRGSADASAADIITQVNNFRATLGLQAFTYNPQLTVAAQQQAEYIAQTNSYTHTGFGGSTPQTRATAAGYVGRVSENIVGGSDMTPAQGLAWWRNSPVHYNTITSDYYTEIGGGFAVGSLRQNIYAIVVGNPSGTPRTNTTTAQPAPIAAPRFIQAEPGEDGSIVHTIRAGQAMWTLAAYYDVELAYLYRINNLSENDFVRPGDEILVRLADGVPTPTPLPTPTPPFEHVVQRGQTLWTIAALHGLEIGELLYLNGLNEGSFLQPGDALVVRLRPGQLPPPTATPQLTHEVQAGQSLWAIAARYELTLEQLLALNGLSENAFIQPGDVLLIRDAGQAVAETLPEATPTPAPTATSSNATPVETAQTVLPQALESASTGEPTEVAEMVVQTAVAVPETVTVSELAPTVTPQILQATGGSSAAMLENLILLGVGAAVFGLVGLVFVLRRG